MVEFDKENEHTHINQRLFRELQDAKTPMSQRRAEKRAKPVLVDKDINTLKSGGKLAQCLTPMPLAVSRNLEAASKSCIVAKVVADVPKQVSTLSKQSSDDVCLFGHAEIKKLPAIVALKGSKISPFLEVHPCQLVKRQKPAVTTAFSRLGKAMLHERMLQLIDYYAPIEYCPPPCPYVEEREAIDLSKFDCPRFVMERPRDYEEVPLDYFPAYSDVEFSPFEDSDETDYKMGLDLINCDSQPSLLIYNV